MPRAYGRAALQGDLGFHQGVSQASVATQTAGETADAAAGQKSQAPSSHGFCHSQPKGLQGDDGTCKGGPTMNPCCSCSH